MRRLAKVAAVAASTAVAAEAFGGDVWGYTTFTCSDEIVVTYDTVEEACRDPQVEAYVDRDDGIFLDCKLCDDDDDGDDGYGPPPPPREIIYIPLCPAGRHSHGFQCHEDHECGNDEIGGGNQDCEPCGEGQVPNPDGTACQSCPYGESKPGVCAADPCGLGGLDHAATNSLSQNAYPREPKERGVAIYCSANDKILFDVWRHSPANNACTVDIPYWLHQQTCWPAGGGRPAGGCRLGSIHTHPYFTEADRGTICHGDRINEDLAIAYNDGGMVFSQADNRVDFRDGVDGYLGVSDRSCVRANRATSGGVPIVVAGACTKVPLPHTPWSAP